MLFRSKDYKKAEHNMLQGVAIRKKIGDSANIRTVRGIGYQIEAK